MFGASSAGLLVLLLGTQAQQFTVTSCQPGNVCEKHNHESCTPIVQQLRDKSLKPSEVVCEINPIKLCCPSPNARDNLPADEKDSPAYIPSSEDYECGFHVDLANIVGGKQTKPGQYPFTVALGYLRGNEISYECGGSLINKWFVLTAAHCEKVAKIANVGDWQISEDEDCFSSNGRTRKCLPRNQVIKVEKMIVHEEYRVTQRNVFNDIALVKLEKPVVYHPESVVPICLPIGSQYNFDLLGISNFKEDLEGVRAHAVGWGRTQNFSLDFQPIQSETGSVATTDILLQVDLPVNTHSQCKNSWKNVGNEAQFCAGGEEGKDSCSGDSGGPLVVNKFSPSSKKLIINDIESQWFLAGLTSYGTRFCGSGSPGVYTRVSFYIDWIKEKMNEER